MATGGGVVTTRVSSPGALMKDGVLGACSAGGSTGGAAAAVIGSGRTVVVVVIPVVAAASLRIAKTAPVPTSTMAAKVPPVTSSGRHHCWRLVVLAAEGSSGVKRTRARAALTPLGASSSVAITGMSGTSSTSDHASARRVPVPEAGAEATTVRPSSSGLRTARMAAPRAAVSSGCGVVITGTRSRSDSAVVTAGMLAPPPTEATAARSVA